MAILIALEKFTIKRIYLDLAASLITSCPQGYLLSDRCFNDTVTCGFCFLISILTTQIFLAVMS